MRAAVPRILVSVLAGLALVFAALSATAGASPTLQNASLMLDFTPNAIHSGIYLALARHYDRRNGIRLQVRIPGESTDAISLLSARRVQFAI
ncbi:MAG: hypothetical protein ACP5H2_12260, partial [Solirubrobacteraceae bacterium]